VADAAHSAGCSGHEDRVVVVMVRRHGADPPMRAMNSRRLIGASEARQRIVSA
jgi:hypothetical protein